MAFGYGHLTWEWKRGIRGCLHPLLIAIPYKILAILNIDNPATIKIANQLIGLITASGCDWATFRLAQRLFGHDVANDALICQLLSWCYFFCMPRTLSNSLEAALTTAALAFWPWIGGSPGGAERRALALAAAAFLVRPTSALLFAPLALAHICGLAAAGDRAAAARFLANGAAAAAAVGLCAGALADRACYGRWVVSPAEFLRFNVLEGGAAIYGTHPWHWYLVEVRRRRRHRSCVLHARLLPLLRLAAWMKPQHSEFLSRAPSLSPTHGLLHVSFWEWGPIARRRLVAAALCGPPARHRDTARAS
jgi:GPI mannosyltransferase 3